MTSYQNRQEPLPDEGLSVPLPSQGTSQGSRTNRLSLIIILLVAIGSLAVALYADGPAKLLSTLKGANDWWLAAGVGCMLGYWLLESLVLHITALKTYPKQSFANSVRTSMIGQLFNCITPFASGGQPIQAYHMVRGGMSLGSATSTLLAKFIVYQTVLTLYSLVVLLFKFKRFSSAIVGFSNLVLVGFAVNCAVVAGLLCVGFFPRLTKSFLRSCAKLLANLHIVKDPEQALRVIETETDMFHKSFSELRRHGGLIVQSSLLTAVQLTLFFSVPYCVCTALGIPGLNYLEIISAGAFILMISSFVPLPGASGGAEGSFYMFFKIFFPTGGSISIAILLWRLLTFYLPIAAGTYFARYLTRKVTSIATPKAS